MQARIEERTKARGNWITRALAYPFSIAAAPFTGGLSLLGIAVAEAQIAGGGKRIQRLTDQRSAGMAEDACSDFNHQIQLGQNSGMKRYLVDLSDYGYGKIERSYQYELDDEDEE